MSNGKITLAGGDGSFEGAKMAESNVGDVVHGLQFISFS